MTKKIINAVARYNIRYRLQGTLKDALKEIQELINELGEEATIDIDTETEEYSNCEYAYVRVYQQRLETDEEYAERLAAEQRYKERREQVDRETYERLKKQFGEA